MNFPKPPLLHIFQPMCDPDQFDFIECCNTLNPFLQAARSADGWTVFERVQVSQWANVARADEELEVT